MLNQSKMQVIKRNGKKELVSYDKVLNRIQKLVDMEPKLKVDVYLIAKDVINQIYDDIQTQELDIFASKLCMELSLNEIQYADLAKRILVSNLHKSSACKTFSGMYKLLDNLQNPEVNKILHNKELKKQIDSYIDLQRDYLLDYFGLQTLMKSYLIKKNGKMECPQHLFMRVALGLHKKEVLEKGILDNVFKTYDIMSTLQATHATPTLFNSGTHKEQMSSCFLMGLEDSMEGIMKGMSDMAKISKWAGGIGINVSTIRSKGAEIRGTNGKSSGIIPMLKVMNELGKYANQGSKRLGSIACFVSQTKVCTINAGIKNIEDIQVGDLVITHKNRVQPVEQVHKNPLGDRKIYKLCINGTDDIYVTGNHRFWSFMSTGLKSNQKSLGWNSVEDLKTYLEGRKSRKCYIASPNGNGIKKDTEVIDLLEYKEKLLDNEKYEIVEKEDDKIVLVTSTYNKENDYYNKSHGIPCNRYIAIDEDFAYILGAWLGDGCIRKRNGLPVGLQFTFNVHNKQLIECISELLKKVFGCNVCVEYPKSGSVCVITIFNRIVGTLFNHWFGCYFDGKKLPDFVFSWQTSLVNNLMAGMISTDGTISDNNNGIVIGISNKLLIDQLFYLCRNNGIIVRYPYVSSKIGKKQKCIGYSMKIRPNKELFDRVYRYYDDNRMSKIITDIPDDTRFLKIVSIEETDRQDEYVYTLSVKEDHSYTVEGVIAENCTMTPYHPDIMDFLKIRNNTTDQELACRNLFTALWIPDNFMRAVKNDEIWYLLDPDMCHGLQDTYGNAFELLYKKYVSEKKYKQALPAREIWDEIIRAQTLSGNPFIGFKDNINHKNNQMNIGVIKNSNLCHEILLYSDHENYAVCNLASICLSKCIKNGQLDTDKLRTITRQLVINLNKVIDENYYPVPETKKTNMETRPIGIGVQGLANLFYTLRIPFDSQEAKELNKLIFETIQVSGLEMSCELAEQYGSYPKFQGSPMSKGQFQHNLWDINEAETNYPERWEQLRERVLKHGLRNSVVTALMPTASSSQIMGNFESFEPITSNIFRRNTLAGEFVVINKYLIEDLIKLNLWNDKMKDRIILANGSIQGIKEIPEDIRRLYKTVWEIKQKDLIDLSLDRGPFIDMCQSYNIYYGGSKEDMYKKLTSMYFYSWERGQKTGCYYVRSKPSSEAISYKKEEECISCSA